MPFSAEQLSAISITERVCSAVSLSATAIVIVSFLSSKSFRKPINRLVFYASWGNILTNVATVISRSGIEAGVNTPLCQFQAFFIQWFMPADALWTFSMACNVYLTFFHKYNSEQLRRIEWKYFLFCYGVPLIPAFTYFFISDERRGRIYGSATLWCWVSPTWDFLRIAVFYGPVWLIIFLTLAIYLRTGKVIYQKRRQLRMVGSFDSTLDSEIPFEPIFSKNPEIRVTKEVTSLNETGQQPGASSSSTSPKQPESVYSPYSVVIEGGQGKDASLSPPKNDRLDSRLDSRPRRRTLVSETNSAAWAYIKYAILFFIALIITWVPSTINRVYAYAYPTKLNYPLHYLSCFVLPLQGFWNGIIYVSISWPAFRSAMKNFQRDYLRRSSGSLPGDAACGMTSRQPGDFYNSDSTQGLIRD